MQSSRTGWVAVLVATAGLGLAPKPGAAAEAKLSCPATAPAGGRVVAEITINVGATTALGAYSMMLAYDPAVLRITSVAGGMTPEFAGTPTTRTSSPGTTNVAAFQSASLDSPKGVVSVAKITLDVVATASKSTSIGLTVSDLYDTNVRAILPATGAGCTVAVTGPTSTTNATRRRPRRGSSP